MFIVYVLNIRNEKMYYVSDHLFQGWSPDRSIALPMTFEGACRVKGRSKERYIEEI